MNPQRLVEARKAKNLSQREVGEALGINNKDQAARIKISRYERGETTPPYNVACKIAEILDVPTCYFYIDDDLFAEKVLRLFKEAPSNEIESNLITTLKKKNKKYEKILKNIQNEINSTNSP
ncbi:putative DNA binding protein [Xenorhabdus bovienii str. puntauvense]|uniref:Putative DNA binding protein n=1 Tax=Xenorhabdus bovienii str. puntauvense TaxID=1398201 RepID=A0A077NAU0_XENBV|nr:helix-turn-helix transcriptional regulator [Xenorhabdus bovienii]CDG96139.1 putative DNA binding protein [Xenorhabdus bovienii str. puntauvense]